jgi:hypothetical protein
MSGAPRYTLHEGFRMPMGFPVAGLASGQAYEPDDGDVFVSTYPKCGTTWMQYIVLMIVRRGCGLAAGETINDAFPHLEEVGKDAVARWPRPRLIKTHLPFPRAPWSPAAKYIYVARNPFDCAVSFYHHTRGFVQHYDFADGTFDEFFECFVAGEVDFGDYFDHLLSWYTRKGQPNVLFETYETMLADPAGAVVRVGEFLGREAVQTVRDAGRLAAIVAETSFPSMRENQGRWSSARPADMPAFVRKGVVGDWRTHFSARQAERLVAKFAERTGGTPCAELWSDQIAAAKRHAGPQTGE